MSKNERVIITGGLGYIGYALTEALRHASIDHMSLDRRAKTGDSARALDLCNVDAVEKLIKEYKPTVIVHAGTHSAIAYKENFFESFQEDFAALCSLLKILKNFPDTRLIYFSSNYVYSGLPCGLPVTEKEPILPAHNFGVGKYFFEEYILRNHSQSVVFRLSSVFGKGPAQHPNALFNMAEEARKTGKITVWGKGARMVQYVYLPDVVRFTRAAFLMKPGLYNLGGNEYVSVSDAAHAVADLLGAKIVLLKEKAEGETLPKMDTSKLLGALPKKRFTLFQNALAEYLRAV